MSGADGMEAETAEGSDVAVIGMAGRFPGAPSVERFWSNLCAGVESIRLFTDDELLAAGVPEEILRNPTYVKAGSPLEGVDLFDAAFFGFNPREAETMDPQQRLFLTCAWEALENAGYDPEGYGGAIGLVAGTGISTYLLNNLYPNRDLVRSVGELQLALGNDKDSLATRTAYLLNLRGPCYTVQTYCSTSLVAIAVACESLASGACDMALAGGVAIMVPQNVGYFYQEGGVTSPDGRCRAFDVRAQGAPLGNGVGLVVLKRLADALADGDRVHAVIKGVAVNNDGAMRASYTAPGVDGQAQVIAEALANADVHPDTLGYIEAHGTGTALGDPIEIAALASVFRSYTGRKQFCGIGSLKPNVGHLDRASGVASLIKAVLALENRLIPPSLHYSEPNPRIDFANSPFYVNTELREWPADGSPRRAGVSAFGIGGTNAHVVLEEAPETSPGSPSRAWQLLLLSAKTPEALAAAGANLAQHLREHHGGDLADVAFTLQVGRKAFQHRRALVAAGPDDAAAALEAPERMLTGVATMDREVTFLFPHGEGPSAALYQQEPTYRRIVDGCGERLGLAPGRLLGDPPAGLSDAARFVAGYALARLWKEWGVTPKAVAGEGAGELAAACVAGLLTVEEALALLTAPAGTAAAEPLPKLPSIPFVLRDGERALLEIGRDGELAAALALAGGEGRTIASLPAAAAEEPEGAHLLGALAKLWLVGVPVDWKGFCAHERRRRVPLPTYPFEPRRFWVDPPADDQPAAPRPQAGKKADPAEWFYLPLWRQTAPARRAGSVGPAEETWLALVDDTGLGDELVERLRAEGRQVVTARVGTGFARVGEGDYVIDPSDSGGYRRLLDGLDETPGRILHFWSVPAAGPRLAGGDLFRASQ
ncbi:MAG TPA: type I polyketide synthase, partial [Thermoanaerobaculia bacterium]|nr:type I polyketide synthase [Thermoanaerobaculia bacterium]